MKNVCACVSQGATHPDKSPLTLSCLTAQTVFAQWINRTYTLTHIHTASVTSTTPPTHPSPISQGITREYARVRVFMCVRVQTEAFTHRSIGRLRASFSVRPRSLCILTLW